MANILVVEDQEEIAALIKFKLKSVGHEVVHAENGKIGFEMAQANIPDLILLDVMMPVMNGLDTLKALKGDDRLKSIPVIMLSAKAGESAIVEGFKLGVEDYITKPFRSQEFIARIDAVLSRHKKTTRA